MEIFLGHSGRRSLGPILLRSLVFVPCGRQVQDVFNNAVAQDIMISGYVCSTNASIPKHYAKDLDATDCADNRAPIMRRGGKTFCITNTSDCHVTALDLVSTSLQEFWTISEMHTRAGWMPSCRISRSWLPKIVLVHQHCMLGLQRNFSGWSMLLICLLLDLDFPP
jgi:hypothetical protein